MEFALPNYDFHIEKSATGLTIYDRLRKRAVALTPEEWVRQRFVEWLIAERGFPPELMGNEVSLVQNGIKRRCDTVVADRAGRPLVVVEYKASSVPITQKVFDQIARYDMVLRAPYLIVSNGMDHYCCRIDIARSTYAFLKDIPHYESLKSDIQ